MKKIILSIILVCTLLCGACIPSFAMNDEEDIGTEVNVQNNARYISVSNAFFFVKDILDTSCRDDENDESSPLCISSAVVYDSDLNKSLRIFANQESVEEFLSQFLKAQRDGTPEQDDTDDDGYIIGLHYFNESYARMVLRILYSLMIQERGNDILRY